MPLYQIQEQQELTYDCSIIAPAIIFMIDLQQGKKRLADRVESAAFP